MFKIEMTSFGKTMFVKNTWLDATEAQLFKTEAAAQKKINSMYKHVLYEIVNTAKIVKV